MKLQQFFAIASVGIFISACAPQQGGRYGNNTFGGNGLNVDKKTIGTIAGAAGGAALGSQIGKGRGNIIAVALGTLLGAGLGQEVGASLDRGDIAYYNKTSQKALETGQPGQVLPWNNPQTGVSGTVTPSNYYQTAQGRYCREYTQSISVGGQVSQGYGTACRQPDGTWQIVE